MGSLSSVFRRSYFVRGQHLTKPGGIREATEVGPPSAPRRVALYADRATRRPAPGKTRTNLLSCSVGVQKFIEFSLNQDRGLE